MFVCLRQWRHSSLRWRPRIMDTSWPSPVSSASSAPLVSRWPRKGDASLHHEDMTASLCQFFHCFFAWVSKWSNKLKKEQTDKVWQIENYTVTIFNNWLCFFFFFPFTGLLCQQVCCSGLPRVSGPWTVGRGGRRSENDSCVPLYCEHRHVWWLQDKVHLQNALSPSFERANLHYQSKVWAHLLT